MSRGKTHDNQDAVLITRRLHEFLDDYAPNFITSSDHTLKAYEDALALYFEFLQVKGVTPDTLCRSHLERSWIEDWMVWLRVERGNSPQTVNNRLSSMRKFLDYLARKEVSLAYIYAEAKAIERLKVPKRHVEGMSKEAVKALLAAPDAATPIGRRDLTFMATMYGTGARLDELRSLTWGQLHLDAPKPYVTYLGKGDKPRTVYLLPREARMLRRYAAEALGPNPLPGALLFPSRTKGGPMTEAAWDKRIKKYAAIAHESCPEVPVGAHAHLLRHSAATVWLDDGMNVVEVQHLLGHEDIRTTMFYIDVKMSSKADGMSVLESEADKAKDKKWHEPGSKSLTGYVGVRRER